MFGEKRSFAASGFSLTRVQPAGADAAFSSIHKVAVVRLFRRCGKARDSLTTCSRMLQPGLAVFFSHAGKTAEEGFFACGHEVCERFFTFFCKLSTVCVCTSAPRSRLVMLCGPSLDMNQAQRTPESRTDA